MKPRYKHGLAFLLSMLITFGYTTDTQGAVIQLHPVPGVDAVLGPVNNGRTTSSSSQLSTNNSIKLYLELASPNTASFVTFKQVTYNNQKYYPLNRSWQTETLKRGKDGAYFQNIEVRNDGYAAVDLTTNTNQRIRTYIRVGTIDSNLMNIASLPTKKLTASTMMYADEKMLKPMFNLGMGTPYKVLRKSNNKLLICKYQSARGPANYVGWIKDLASGSNTPTPVIIPNTGIKGDVNGDRVVDFKDSALLDKYLNNISTPINKTNADLDGNGRIDIADYNHLVIKINEINQKSQIKKVLNVAISNPLKTNFAIYSDITGKKYQKTENISESMLHNGGHGTFLDAEIYNNGMTKLNYRLNPIYVKTSEIIYGVVFDSEDLIRPKTASQNYKLYTSSKCIENNTFEDKDTILKGTSYVPFAKKDGARQVFVKGRGGYSYLGWIKEDYSPVVPSTKIKGDVDNNGIINNNDLTMLKNYLIGIKANAFNKENADMNGDGVISSTDVGLLNALINPVKIIDAKMANGWYEIIPAQDSTGKLRMDVDNAVDADGVNIKLCNSNNEYAQRFYLENTSDGYFTLKTGCSSSRYVTMRECSSAVGNNIIQNKVEPFNGQTQQKFKLTRLNNESGIYFIDSKIENGAVIGYNNLAHYGNVAIMNKGNGTKYKWRFKPVAAPTMKVVYPSSGLYSIQPKCAPGKELTVQGASTANSANVFIYASNSLNHVYNPSHQKWNVQRIDNSEWYKITAENSGKALNIHNGISANGTPVTIYDYGGTMHQFRFLDAGNGYFVLQGNVGGQYVLDVANGGNANGTDVRMWAFNGSDAQKWKLERRDPYKVKPVPPNPTPSNSLASLANSWRGKKWDNRESSSIGSTCFGFANYIFRELHGTIAGRSYNSGRYRLTYLGNGVKEVYTTSQANINILGSIFDGLTPGSFIQGNKINANKQHSMILYSYDRNNKIITVLDANWATVPDNVVRIHSFTLKNFAERFPRFSVYKK